MFKKAWDVYVNYISILKNQKNVYGTKILNPLSVKVRRGQGGGETGKGQQR